MYPVNVTKSAEMGGFGHIYWRNSYWKTSFLCGELGASNLYKAKTGVPLEWILGERHVLGLMSWSNKY